MRVLANALAVGVAALAIGVVAAIYRPAPCARHRLEGPCEIRAYQTSHGAAHVYEACPTSTCPEEP